MVSKDRIYMKLAIQSKQTSVRTHSLNQTDTQPTLDNDASPITSIPSIRSAPLFSGLTVKAAGPFTS